MPYHTAHELMALGEKIRERAIEVGLKEIKRSASVADDHNAAHIIASYKTRITNDVQDIPSLYASFYVPDPAGWDSAIHDLVNVSATWGRIPAPKELHGKLYMPPAFHTTYNPPITAESAIGKIKYHTRDWKGHARNSFQTDFEDALPGALFLQGWLATALAAVLEYEASFRIAINKDIHTIGEKTLDVLDQLNDMCPGTGDATAVLGLLGAVASMATSSGMNLPLAISSATAILSSIHQGQSDISKKITVEGHREDGQDFIIEGWGAESAIASMRKAIDRLIKGMVERERSVVGALREIRGFIDGRRSKLLPSAPNSVVKFEDESVASMRSQFYPD